MRAALFALAVACSFAFPAQARNGGLYLELAPSWGFYASDEAVIEEGNDDFGSFPVATFVPALKLGLNLFGWAGVEGHVTGHYWDLDNDFGGGGYVGGVVRITPLEALRFVLPADVQVPSLVPAGPVAWTNRPFDLGVSFGGGYSLIGEDYAYEGSYFQWGFDVKWFITPNVAVGLDFPFRHMLYEPFRYANFNERSGYCTDGAEAYGFVGDTKVSAPASAGIGGPQIPVGDKDERCTDRPPSAFFFAPALTLAGVFDFGI